MNVFDKFKFSFLAIFFLSPAHCLLFGQPTFAPFEQSLEAPISFAEQSPVIDGKLTESEWVQTSIINNFIQIEPYQGNSSEFASEVRLLYTAENLYIGVFCADPEGTESFRAPTLSRDFAWKEHDTFAIAIDGLNDKRSSVTFATNPYGAQVDYISFDDVLFDEAWNGLWKVRTSRSDSGWVAEFEIPFKTLRYLHKEDQKQEWGINFLRLRRKSNELSVWSPYPRSVGFNRMEYAGILKDFLVPKPSSNIQVSPYLSLNDNDLESKIVQEVDIKPGGDVKWAVTPNTVLDFTINTDFAQAEADVQVANINRFNILFPEKRPFFLENASFFGTGLMQRDDGTGGNMQILPFFSRRIGLDSAGVPIPISGGVRAVHRSVNKNAGFLYMRQQKSDITPATHTAVGRFSQNIGKRNRIGALTTMHATSGDNSYINWLGAVDGFFRVGEAHAINTMIMQSGYSSNDSSGIGGYAQYTYTTNSIKGWWTQSLITRNFNPELGFVSREDILATTPGIYTTLRGKWLPLKSVIRSFQPAIETAWYHQASSGILTERQIMLYPFWLGLQSGGFIGYSISWNYQFLISDFHPLGIPIDAGTYSYNRHAFYIGSDPSKILSYQLQHDFGNYFDGRLASTDVSFSAVPIPQINIQLKLNQNNFQGIGSEEVSRVMRLYTLQSNFALNPRILLSSLYQRNTQQKTDAINIRFKWEYKPLSYLYLVINSREFLDTENLLQNESSAIIKVTYLKQF